MLHDKFLWPANSDLQLRKVFSIVSNFYFSFPVLLSPFHLSFKSGRVDSIFSFTWLIQFSTVVILFFIDYNLVKNFSYSNSFLIFFHYLHSSLSFLVWDFHLIFLLCLTDDVLLYFIVEHKTSVMWILYLLWCHIFFRWVFFFYFLISTYLCWISRMFFLN